MNISDRPYLTAELPGVGGRIKCEIEDFQVEEVPLYEAEGDGQHAYIWVEKRNVASGKLLGELASHYGVRKRDIGAAGNKDKHAVTRQWVSLPFHEIDADDPAELVGIVNDGTDAGIEVLEAKLHRNKLRTGHLEGNRFRVIIRELEVGIDQAVERAREVCNLLEEQGMPNYYGLQRFGDRGETLRLGLGYLRGESEAKGRLRRNHFLKRLAASAAQSEVFNRVLAERMRREILRTVFDGDVVKKTDTGGVFVVPTEEYQECQGRLDRREIVTTGPMPGPSMIAPERDAAAFEAEVLELLDIDPEIFERHPKLTRGTRRPLLVEPGGIEVEAATRDGDDVLVVGFSLPSGTYATVLLREIMKRDDPS